jgi:hypothetical protein
MSWKISARKLSSALSATHGDFQVLVEVNMWCARMAENGGEELSYLFILGQRVDGGLELVGVLNGTHITRAKRSIGCA